jgi:hypothetical protein
MQLTYFLSERYEERFFSPIRCLIGSEIPGYGFAIMSLCCLLIETIQCYRLGWPASSPSELKKLADLDSEIVSIIPPMYKLAGPFPGTKFGSKIAFKKFFETPEHLLHFREFAGMGEEFYDAVRCGLLHQAQTKRGWRVRMTGDCYREFSWGKGINRNEFAQSLYTCFRDFLRQLEGADWDQSLWQPVLKKLWWLAITS